MCTCTRRPRNERKEDTPQVVPLLYISSSLGGAALTYVIGCSARRWTRRLAADMFCTHSTQCINGFASRTWHTHSFLVDLGGPVLRWSTPCPHVQQQITEGCAPRQQPNTDIHRSGACFEPITGGVWGVDNSHGLAK